MKCAEINNSSSVNHNINAKTFLLSVYPFKVNVLGYPGQFMRMIMSNKYIFLFFPAYMSMVYSPEAGLSGESASLSSPHQDVLADSCLEFIYTVSPQKHPPTEKITIYQYSYRWLFLYRPIGILQSEMVCGLIWLKYSRKMIMIIWMIFGQTMNIGMIYTIGIDVYLYLDAYFISNHQW